MKETKKFKVRHNLYDLLGHNLLFGIREGKVDPNTLNMLSGGVSLDLGKGYTAHAGYNEPLFGSRLLRGRRQDFKFGITKDIDLFK